MPGGEASLAGMGACPGNISRAPQQSEAATALSSCSHGTLLPCSGSWPHRESKDASTQSGAAAARSAVRVYLLIHRLETGEHLFRFRDRLERNAIAHFEEFAPQGQHVRIPVNRIDGFERFPF